jgi:hypothetical protein
LLYADIAPLTAELARNVNFEIAITQPGADHHLCNLNRARPIASLNRRKKVRPFIPTK